MSLQYSMGPRDREDSKREEGTERGLRSFEIERRLTFNFL